MKLRFVFVLALATFCNSSYSQESVSFCDLLRNPEKYDGKEVIVRATWRYGFEWSQFYCIDCLPKQTTWLEISPDLDEKSSRVLRRRPKSGIVNITVQGIFQSGGHFGHLNGYQNRFIAREVKDVVVVSSGMKSPENEQRVEKQWACGGTNPK
ncbi:MAG TPA: hypothetical protein VGJ06_21315 [Candidatus Acidoferrum sp.]|jgi:hypothetical protein